MGIDYAGAMLYGIEVKDAQVEAILSKWLKLASEDEIEEWRNNGGMMELKIPEVPEVIGASIEYSYDDEYHDFLVIKSVYFNSPDYDCKKLPRFMPDYEKWDALLSKVLGKDVKGNWYIMPHAS